MYKFDKYRFTASKGILLLTALALTAFTAFGQTRFVDGQITYSIHVESAGNISPAALSTLEKGSLVFHFKNNLFRSEMHIGNMEYVNIHNSSNHTALSLIKGGPEKNYLVKMSTEDVKKEAEKYNGMTYATQPGTTEIAGYTCRKAIGKLADGKTFTVFYTKELQPASPDYSPRFKGLEGIPLKFEVNTRSDARLVMTATKVESVFQPSSLFDAPTSGFRELTYEQLRQLRGSK